MLRGAGGLRLRLALLISAVSLAVLAASFLALRAGTGSALRAQIDADLTEQWTEFRSATDLGSARIDPAMLKRRARDFVAEQSYHPRSRIFVIQVAGAGVVTNQGALLARESRREAHEPEREALGETGLLRASPGFATVSGTETGRMRVFSTAIVAGARRLGTFRAADPLQPVEAAQAGLSDSFLFVGLGAVLVALAVGALASTVVTRPLRRMAQTASEIDSGALERRIALPGRRDEVGQLAQAFNRMLDRLETAFASQRDFISDASHELRTPLAVLRAQLELIDRELDVQERRRRVRTAVRELDRMNRLVDDMLTLAAAGSTDIVRRRLLPVADLLEDLRRDLPLLGDRDYRLEGIRAGGLRADPERLAQVLRNLVRNAVAVTAPGGRITVTATPREDRLELAVADDGPGLSPEECERVFDRFHRTDAARERRRGGTGLGLAIARALVEAHGGRIWAESEPGEGATFRIELPGYRRTAPHREEAVASPAQSGPGQESFTR